MNFCSRLKVTDGFLLIQFLRDFLLGPRRKAGAATSKGGACVIAKQETESGKAGVKPSSLLVRRKTSRRCARSVFQQEA